jgi:hypothetical protein
MLELILSAIVSGVTPGFKAKSNAHSICAHESGFHTYSIENGYRITNAIIYNIYYTNNAFNKRLSRTLTKHSSGNTITPQEIDRG